MPNTADRDTLRAWSAADVRAWTSLEVRVLRDYAGLGPAALATLLDRPTSAVRAQAHRLGLSLAVVDDDAEVDAEVLRLLVRVRDSAGLSLCPSCARRWVRVPSTGLCRCCHLDALLQLHQEQLDEQIRIRRLHKVRQDKVRVRICDECLEPFFPKPSSAATVCGRCK